jgi:hypothetical protein
VKTLLFTGLPFEWRLDLPGRSERLFTKWERIWASAALHNPGGTALAYFPDPGLRACGDRWWLMGSIRLSLSEAVLQAIADALIHRLQALCVQHPSQSVFQCELGDRCSLGSEKR